jgi:hypothetical protein
VPALETHEPRMREEERERDSDDAFRREPVVGEPEARTDAQVPRLELPAHAADRLREPALFESDSEVAEAGLEQLPVRPVLPRQAPGSFPLSRRL